MDRSDARPAIAQSPHGTIEQAGKIGLYSRAAAVLARLEAALTIEYVLYALFVLAGGFTRFWDLGSRALHHDESLHSYYSWLYATTGTYIHDPMTHGPFLYHANALIFLIFGSSDYTTRIVPALFGTVLIALPFLLRKQLGRVSMLAASFLLLISPDIWYYGRFIRQDIYDVIWEMLIFVGLVRWIDSKNYKWFHVAWISWIFLFTTKESSFIVLFIFATFLVGALLLAHSKVALGWLIAAPIGLLAAMIAVPRILGWAHLPKIPFNNPTFDQGKEYALTVLASPQIELTIAWVLVWIGVMALILYRQKVFYHLGAIGRGEEEANALSTALAAMPRKLLQVGALIAEFLIISVPLYTSLFTNFKGGLLSGSVGSLFYWLAQQGVRRGNQPWFYYGVMEPLYNPIIVLLGSAAVLYSIYWLLKRRGNLGERPGTFLISYAMLAYWAVLTLLIYTWASERMPWIMLEITLPFALLAAVFGTRALGLEEGRFSPIIGKRRGVWALLGIATLISAWVVYRMSSWSMQPNPTGQSPMVYGLIALVILFIIAGVWLGFRPTVRTLSLLGLTILSLYTIRSAIQLSYYHGDVPVDQQIYVQTSPYVPNLMSAITKVSEETTGGKDAAIIYDDQVSWPFVWYLRDFKQAAYLPNGPATSPRSDVEFVIVGLQNQDAIKPYMSNYVAYQYPMRWWFPEEMYRRLDNRPGLGEPIKANGKLDTVAVELGYLAKGISAWGDPSQQAMLWRYMMYRNVDGTIYSFDMVVYVRKDLVGKFNAARLH